MSHYIIDGNNLIGKIKSLKELQKRNKQGSREGLVSMLNNYFAGKKIKATLHLDGHPNTALSFPSGRIIYSEKRNSDSMICEEIDNSKNPKLITVISSDHRIINYARANSCTPIKSEDFYCEIKKSYEKNDEQERLKQLEKQNDFFFNLFNKK
jgi:uncharacterized protein